jgi:uncharacterized protein HemX
MIGYLILGCVILTAITCIVVYVTGWKQGKEKAASEYTKEKTRQEAIRVVAENERQTQEKKYREKAIEIRQEASQNAETRKAELSGYRNAVDRFNTINDSLCQSAGNTDKR